jgi:hypothetical protein
MCGIYDRDVRIINYAIDVSNSLNVFIEIATDDHSYFKPPNIIIDGNLCDALPTSTFEEMDQVMRNNRKV